MTTSTKGPYPFMMQGKNVMVVIDDVPHTITESNMMFKSVIDAIKAQDWDKVAEVVDTKSMLVKFSNGNLRIEEGVAYWNDNPMGPLSKKIIDMHREGFPIEPMVNFMTNLLENPSMTAVSELYAFLEKSSLPITPDGHFLAYKKVRDDYTDVHSGTISNAIGQKPSMPRNQVDDNRNRTCSAGLHFCSEHYLDHFGGDRIMVVKINPRDVVSIPADYNDSKGRCSTYEVISEVTRNAKGAFTRAVQETATVDEPPLDDEGPAGNEDMD